MREWLGRCLRAYAERSGRGYPDWATRYVPLVGRLKHRLPRMEWVLEIGANENGFARFAECRTVAVDLRFEHLVAARGTQDILPVQADITVLPFRKGAFDLCVCVDTFEHLDPGTRALAAESIVASIEPEGTGVVTFPCGQEVERAEAEIREAYTLLTGQRLGWLEEHVSAGLPDADEIASHFKGCAKDVHTVRMGKNTNLAVWKMMWKILMCGWPGPGNALAQALLRFATPLLCRIHWGKCYRRVIWIEPKP